MELQTSLIEYNVSVDYISSFVEKRDLQDGIKQQLFDYDFKKAHGFPLDFGDKVGFVFLFMKDNGSTIKMQLHPNGLITLDINEYVPYGDNPYFSGQVLEEFERKISTFLNAKQKPMLRNLKRGSKFNTYFPTTDEKIIEYDFDELVFEETSPYQNVKVYHSKQFGNMLILDDDPNLAESDLLYTQSITGYPNENYNEKTVLILGGGDGGILHELLKQNPKFITMVDIDEVVVNAAKKHLRGICYDSMDQLTGENYEVLIADCVPILKAYIKEGKTFDYVINDLTAIPVTTEPRGDMWDFLRLILDLSMKVLAKDGKYFTQGNGYNMTSALKMYEDQLQKLDCPVDFCKVNTFVPSYHELWVFYEIWKKQ